jgi:hypothetical protein
VLIKDDTPMLDSIESSQLLLLHMMLKFLAAVTRFELGLNPPDILLVAVSVSSWHS